MKSLTLLGRFGGGAVLSYPVLNKFVMSMAACNAECSDEANDDNKPCFKIIIVGAGIAGISAAYHLAKNGETHFKILEARDGIGGRILSMPMGSGIVDLGASWIHGVLGNPVYELSLSNSLIQITEDHRPHTIVATTEDGKRVPISVIEEVYSAYFWFCKRCEEYYLLNLHPPPQVGNSVGKHLEMDITAYLEQYEGEERHIRRMVFDHLLSRETCITGCDSMDETGLTDFGSYTELPGGNISIPGGFFSVIDFLTKSLPKNCIELQAAVKRIKWKNLSLDNNKTVCSVENCAADKPCEKSEDDFVTKHTNVLVECENGAIWHTDHLILTLPLGVLKLKAQDIFEPPLPDYKTECLEKLCFGVVDKIFLEYDRPFLNPEISEVITLWNRTEESDLSKTWYRKIYSFSRLTENVLLAWVSGKEAEYVESLSFEQVGETCTQILRKFLNDPYVPKPYKVVCTSWGKHPYTLGSYTSIGTKGCQRDIDLLATPIYSDPYQSKPVLLFAGEATHSTFYSTTHGAFLSGRRCAELLLEPDSTASGSGISSGMSDRNCQSSGDLSSWLRGIDLT